ncbi:hypothetical protein ACTOB_007074 [Actinoplanes oblitus]|uniref:Peptidase S1 domain-containing protein n=1 Tax=Actinoplanes oblitus TaxID=3040509 RepID=A0ABY8WD91_9ACTN|nr:hypothetical protein [Actinoplanes oblitus]WIM95013.1 hypothetical protein ACTOB_007074 [Actinoplanes oblitus]
MALIEVWPGKSVRDRVYRGGHSSTSSFQVRSMWHRRAAAGDKFCTGGKESGEICDWTVSKTGVDVKTDLGLNHNEVTSKSQSGWCPRHGDSGGPVYTVNSDGTVAAKGIISSGSGGGTDHYAGSLDLHQCAIQFTDIYDAYQGFPGSLWLW